MNFPFSDYVKLAAGGTSVFKPNWDRLPKTTAPGTKQIPLGKGVSATVHGNHDFKPETTVLKQRPESNVYELKAGSFLPFTAIMKVAAARCSTKRRK